VKSLKDVIAESLALIYGWPVAKVQSTAEQMETDIDDVWNGRAELRAELNRIRRGRRLE
jgi:hypothetical protein